MGLTPSTADALLGAGRRRHHVSGNHIWDKREIYPYLDSSTSGSCARSTTARTASPAAAGASTTRSTARRSRSSTPRAGRTCSRSRTRSPMPTRCSTRSSEPLPPVRLVDFHCELTSEKNALGLYLDGRVSAVVGHAHPRRHRRRADPAGRDRVPDRPRDDRAGLERHRVRSRRPSCRGSSTRCRRGSRSATARSSSTRPRSTSTRRPAEPWRSSASSGSSRSERGRRRDRVRPRHRRAASRRARPLPARWRVARRPRMHAHDPFGWRPRAADLVRDVAAAGVRYARITDHDTLAGYRELVAGAGRAGGPRAHPGRRDQRARHARPRAVGAASSTSSASGWTPTTRRSSRRSPRQRPGPADPVRADRRRCCARSGCRSMRRSRRST